MPRKYIHIQEHEKEIFEMRDQGMTWREIGEKFGFSKNQMKQFNNRHNRKQRNLTAGIPQNPRGGPEKGKTKNQALQNTNMKLNA